MTDVHNEALARISFLADELARIQAAMVAAVTVARDGGASLRAIAEAAGMSHESVRRMSEPD